jgi:hypothetical protein
MKRVIEYRIQEIEQSVFIRYDNGGSKHLWNVGQIS